MDCAPGFSWWSAGAGLSGAWGLGQGGVSPASSSWKHTLEHVDYKRVLYGTDACLHDIGWEMGRLLSEDIEDEKLDAILGGNAMRLFGFAD